MGAAKSTVCRFISRSLLKRIQGVPANCLDADSGQIWPADTQSAIPDAEKMLSLAFLPASGYVTAGVPRGVSRAAAANMNLAEGTLNVGVIGAGRIGLVHLEALASVSEAKPIIISNPTVSKAEAAAANYPGMEFSGSDMDVINHPDVEAVWICSRAHDMQRIEY